MHILCTTDVCNLLASLTTCINKGQRMYRIINYVLTYFINTYYFNKRDRYEVKKLTLSDDPLFVI